MNLSTEQNTPQARLRQPEKGSDERIKAAIGKENAVFLEAIKMLNETPAPSAERCPIKETIMNGKSSAISGCSVAAQQLLSDLFVSTTPQRGFSRS